MKEYTASQVFFVVTLVTGPIRSLSLKLSDTRVYAAGAPLAARTPGGNAPAAPPRPDRAMAVGLLLSEVGG